jgi:glycerol-3-phosphate dehydrogenase subunit C
MNPITKEGGLGAPTRHNIDWKNPSFWNESELNDELFRVFDICHGCRRCVSLCDAFPTLFDLIDESTNFDLESVDKKDYTKVVDECYLCDLCYQTKCPYVPPHEWNLDFPHLMLRAKALKFKNNKFDLRSKIRNFVLSSTDLIFSIGNKPLLDKIFNFLLSNKLIKILLQKFLKIHHAAALPKFDSNTIIKRYKNLKVNNIEVKSTKTTTGKVKLFATCYCSFSEPEISEDLVKVFQHNEILVELCDKENCCGMPKLELGDLAAVEKLKDKNIVRLYEYVEQGWDIVSPVPSCVLMFKQELPLLFPNDKKVQMIKEKIFDPFEYLSLRDKEGLFKKDFKQKAQNIAYQPACHQRVQNLGPKTKELLSYISNENISMIERCSGHDGSYAIKAESFEKALKIRKPVISKINKGEFTNFTSDCPMAAKFIGSGIENEKNVETNNHPISLIRKSYDI